MKKADERLAKENKIVNACLNAIVSLNSKESPKILLNVIKTGADDIGAAFGLFSIKDLDKEYVKTNLKGSKTILGNFVLAILGESEGKTFIKNCLENGSIQERLQAAGFAGILRDKNLIGALNNLLEYTNSSYYPTDLYVRQAAWKALVDTIWQHKSKSVSALNYWTIKKTSAIIPLLTLKVLT